MKFNRKTINSCSSIIKLVIYLFGSSVIFSYHNHDHSNDHNSQHLLCENFVQTPFCDLNCAHPSHIATLKERCVICDHFSNCDPAIFEITIKPSAKLALPSSGELFSSLYLNDLINTLNKSPPLII